MELFFLINDVTSVVRWCLACEVYCEEHMRQLVWKLFCLTDSLQVTSWRVDLLNARVVFGGQMGGWLLSPGWRMSTAVGWSHLVWASWLIIFSSVFLTSLILFPRLKIPGSWEVDLRISSNPSECGRWRNRWQREKWSYVAYLDSVIAHTTVQQVNWSMTTPADSTITTLTLTTQLMRIITTGTKVCERNLTHYIYLSMSSIISNPSI